MRYINPRFTYLLTYFSTVSINKVIQSLTKRLRAYVKAGMDISKVLSDKLFIDGKH